MTYTITTPDGQDAGARRFSTKQAAINAAWKMAYLGASAATDFLAEKRRKANRLESLVPKNDKARTYRRRWAEFCAARNEEEAAQDRSWGADFTAVYLIMRGAQCLNKVTGRAINRRVSVAVTLGGD